jgi:CBS domain-containing protein
VNDKIEELAAGDVMSTNLVTIDPDESVWTAWTRMSHHGVRHLIVVDAGNNRCLGVLDDRRLLLDWPSGPAAVLNRQVRQLVPYRTRCVLPDATLRDVAWVMRQHSVDSVPVIDVSGKPLGLVTVTDLVALIAGSRVQQETLAGH